MKDPWKISTLVLAGAVALVAGCTVDVRSPEGGGQPHMEKALQFLREAHQQLQAAAHNKGGHRAAAEQATAEAIHQTEEGIRFANQH